MKRFLIIASACLATFLVVFLFIKSYRLNASVNLYFFPDDAKVTIDGKAVRAGKVRIAAGKHSLHASRSGFADKNLDFNLGKGQALNLNVGLKPNSQEGYDWVSNHPDAVQEAQGITGKFYSDTVDKTLQQNPLIQYLPHVDLHYRIDYGVSVAHKNDPNAVAIIITLDKTASAKNDALAWIRFRGSDPDKLEIIYRHF